MTPLQRARKKIRTNCEHCKELCAYLTSSDVMVLSDAGFVFKPKDLEYATHAAISGLAKPRWYYFFESVRDKKKVMNQGCNK